MNTHNHGDIVEEAAATLGPWQGFLAARRAEIGAQIAQLQGSPPASVVAPIANPIEGSPATTPQSLTPKTEETEVIKGVTATAEAEALANTRDALPKPTDNTAAQDLDGIKDAVPPPSLPTTLAEAEAHFETTLAGVNPATLHAKVREAHRERARDPQRFAEVFVGARAQGYLPAALDGAVEHMTRFDLHFRQAQTLYEDGGYAALFKIEPEEDDLGADEDGEDDDEPEEDGEGEAERAVRRGEDTF